MVLAKVRPLTLLLTSGGGHTGTNVVASLCSRRDALRLIATSNSANEPALFDFDAVYLAPTMSNDGPGFERRLLDIIEREQPDLIIPCRDDDVVWLANFMDRHPAHARLVLCGTSPTAEILRDKWLSHEFSRSHGLPFARSLPCRDSPDAEAEVAAFIRACGLPLVAKPRRDADSRGVLILTTAEQALHAMRRQEHVLQEYLGRAETIRDFVRAFERDGIPLIHNLTGMRRSLQVLIGPAGTIEHVACTRHQFLRASTRSVSRESEDDAPQRIARDCAAAFAAAGWRGPLNIQCLPNADGTLLIHEFNGRFTGATASRWHVGFDEIRMAIKAFTGVEIPEDFPWTDAPDVSMEVLWPRSADPRHMRTLADRGEWMRGDR